MYEPGTLRPPTARELEQRELPLELINIEHHMFCFPPADPARRAEEETYGHIDYQCAWWRHLTDVTTVTIAEVVSLCHDYPIPAAASLCTFGYEGELGLIWNHLGECEGCGLWYSQGAQRAHEESAEHVALVADRKRRTEVLVARAEREREERESRPRPEPRAISPRAAAELMARFTSAPDPA